MAELQQGQAGTWYIIYRTADGVAVSETGDAPVDAALTTAGLAKTTLNHRPDPSIEQWDPVGKAVVPRTPPANMWVAPPASSSYKFTAYEVLDSPAGVQFSFYGPLPGGKSGTVTIVCLDTELATAATTPQLVTLVTSKLSRKLRATGIAAKLDALIGQSVTI